MKISLSLTTSAALQIGFVALALLGSWSVEIEPEPLQYYAESSPRPVVLEVLSIPAPEVVEPDDAPIAKTVEEAGPDAPAPEEPPAVKKPVKPRKAPPKLARKKTKTPPEEEPPPEKTPPEEVQEVKPIVAAAAAEDAPTTPAKLAENAAPVAITKTAATTAPSEGSNPSTTPASAVKTGAGIDRGGKGLGGGVDQAGVFKAYKKRAFKLIDRSKSIPLAAKRARLEGTVYLLVTVDDTGKLLAVKVRKSSGHKVLDQGAIDSLEKLGKLPPLPSELGWKKKTFTLPIRYSMRRA